MNNTNCNSCYFCFFCYSCNSCNSCDSCEYSKGLRMSEYMIFCLGEGRYERKGIGYQQNYHAFNKKVTKERYREIFSYCREVLEGLKLDLNINLWADEWKNVTNEQWKKLAELPEWDKEVVEGIVGFELNLDDKLELSMDEIADKFGVDVAKLKIKKD